VYALAAASAYTVPIVCSGGVITLPYIMQIAALIYAIAENAAALLLLSVYEVSVRNIQHTIVIAALTNDIMMDIDEGLGSFELFIGVYACLIAGVFALNEVTEGSRNKLWWKAAAIECALTGAVLMLWLIVALLLRLIPLLSGNG
jgi:hypothetical protein